MAGKHRFPFLIHRSSWPAGLLRQRAIAALALVLLVPIVFAGCSAAQRGPQAMRRTWQEVQVGDIRVVSQLSEKQTLKFAEDLQRFQQVAGSLTGGARVKPRVPTQLVVVGDERTYSEDARGPEDTAGYFHRGLRSNLAVAKRTRYGDLMETVLHEYLHFLLENQGRLGLPAWYDEGFAQFLSSTEFDDDEVKIGGIPLSAGSAILTQKPLPVAELVTAENLHEWSDTRTTRFYGTSWELVHYLILTSPTRDAFPDQLTRYLKETGRGGDPVRSFEAAFGLSTKEADAALSARRKRGYPVLTVDLPIDAAHEPQVQPLAPAEVALVLGDLHLRRNAPADARVWYERALEMNPDMPHALSGLADTWKFEGDFEKAEPLFQRALALAPEDPLILLDMGEYYDSLSRSVPDPDERRRLRKKERSYYARANRIAPDMPETFVVNGLSHARDRERDAQAMQKALASLEHAHTLLPGNADVTHRLADAYLIAGDREAAAVMIAALGAEGHSRGRGDQLKRLRARLEKLP